MNKIVCSGFVKFFAVILLVASIVCGVLMAVNRLLAYFRRKDHE